MDWFDHSAEDASKKIWALINENLLSEPTINTVGVVLGRIDGKESYLFKKLGPKSWDVTRLNDRPLERN